MSNKDKLEISKEKLGKGFQLCLDKSIALINDAQILFKNGGSIEHVTALGGWCSSLIVSEVSAKLSIVVGAWTGKSAHKGMNTYFINAMHERHRRALAFLGV